MVTKETKLINVGLYTNIPCLTVSFYTQKKNALTKKTNTTQCINVKKTIYSETLSVYLIVKNMV